MQPPNSTATNATSPEFFLATTLCSADLDTAIKFVLTVC